MPVFRGGLSPQRPPRKPTGDYDRDEHGVSGDDRDAFVGDPAPGADVSDLGALSYAFVLRSMYDPTDDDVDRVTDFWDTLGTWHALDDFSFPPRAVGVAAAEGGGGAE